MCVCVCNNSQFKGNYQSESGKECEALERKEKGGSGVILSYLKCLKETIEVKSQCCPSKIVSVFVWASWSRQLVWI